MTPASSWLRQQIMMPRLVFLHNLQMEAKTKGLLGLSVDVGQEIKTRRQ